MASGEGEAALTEPRIRPISPQERDDHTEELLAKVRRRSGEDLNIYATLVRHPSLFEVWLPFGGALLSQGVLGARDRELLILRTAWRCRAEYEWQHHLRLAERVGLTPDEIAATSDTEIDGRRWSAAEHALLRAVDDLHDGSSITNDVWEALAAEFDEQALIEICMLVGHYHMVAFTLNSLGVEVEDA